MSSRRGLLVLVVALGFLTLASFVVACKQGPEVDLHLKRVIISARWDDPPSFRAIDPQGREYDFFVTEKTEINSGTDEKFTWKDIILGDDLEIWANKIPMNPEPDPAHYEVVRIDIAPTAR
jgi:hypothetical protein